MAQLGNLIVTGTARFLNEIKGKLDWSNILNKPSSYTPSSHTHGNIQNGGTLQTNDITIANGDKIVVTDSSDSSKLARTSISFDALTDTKCLTQKGTWETFGTSNLSEPVKTASGEIVTFEGAAELPLNKLKVAIKAKQDLHGYDHPWVGGAGKNKLENIATSQTINGVTFTVNDDGSVLVNGTATNVTYFDINTFSALSQSYIVNGCPVGGSYNANYSIWAISENPYHEAVDSGSGVTINKNFVRKIRIRIANGYTANNLLFKPMIRLATETDATFAPYSNICPISGWSEVNVGVVGKNLVDWKLVSFSSTTNAPVTLKHGTYTLSQSKATNTGNWYIRAKKSDNTYLTNVELGLSNWSTSSTEGVYYGNANAHSFTFTITEDNVTVKVGCQTPATTIPVQLEIGNQASSYVPYNSNSQTTTISLGQTVYGGEVDVVNGVLRITHKMVDLGDLSWATSGTTVSGKYRLLGTTISPVAKDTASKYVPNCISSIYKAISRNDVYTTTNEGISVYDNTVFVYDSNYNSADSASAFTTLVSGQKLVYELAEPIIINLTPTLIKSLNGTNNLSADTGDIMECKYVTQDYDGITSSYSEYAYNAGTVLQKQLSDTSMHQILLSSDTTSNDGYYEVGKTANLYHQKYGSPGYGISTITLIDPNTTPANTLHAAELSVDEANDTSLHLFKRVNTSSQMEGMTITTTDVILNGSTWDGYNTSLKEFLTYISVPMISLDPSSFITVAGNGTISRATYASTLTHVHFSIVATIKSAVAANGTFLTINCPSTMGGKLTGATYDFDVVGMQGTSSFDFKFNAVNSNNKMLVTNPGSQVATNTVIRLECTWLI